MVYGSPHFLLCKCLNLHGLVEGAVAVAAVGSISSWGGGSSVVRGSLCLH